MNTTRSKYAVWSVTGRPPWHRRWGKVILIAAALVAVIAIIIREGACR